MRFLKRMVLAAAVLAVVAAGGWVAWLYLLYPNVPEPAALTVGSSPQKVARGAVTSVMETEWRGDVLVIHEALLRGKPMLTETWTLLNGGMRLEVVTDSHSMAAMGLSARVKYVFEKQ